MTGAGERASVRLRLAAAALAVLAVACAALALRPEPSASGATELATTTPGWSPRRVPGPVVNGVAQLHLEAELAAELSGLDACVVVDGPGGRLVDLAGERPLVPASTIKILTAVAALTTLGHDFRFTTTVQADGPVGGPVGDGIVERLALVGGSDPLLATPTWAAARAVDPVTAGSPTTPLAALADQVVAAGIRSVPGGIVGVAPRDVGQPRYLESWPASYRSNAVGPLSSLTVNGGFRALGVPATDAPQFAAEELARLLDERGVAVGPAVSTASTAPGGAVLAEVSGAPLPEVVGEMLSVSDNLTAELLVRELAATTGTASTEDGLAVVEAALAGLGLDLSGFVPADGSGLSRDNRVPCRLLMDALALTERPDLPALAAVRDGMSVAGRQGTLAPVLAGTPLEGRMMAKTGTLPGVTGLAGFLDVSLPLRFALITNGDFAEGSGVPLRNGVAQTLAGYPDAVPTPEVVPSP